MKEKPWKQAIIQVLKDSGSVMSRTEIAEEIVSKGYRKEVGATPANTVVSYISTSLKNEGERSPFVRVGKGEYALKETIAETTTTEEKEQTDAEKQGAINAFGMFWDRSLVLWKSNPSLLGQQQLGAMPVDMGEQVGIYLLYDGREIVYVGRSVERPIGQRLFEHTQDRLRGRWNRFSWFGLYEVSDKGKISNNKRNFSQNAFIQMLEAVLIESLEPPQNRKRGDEFSGIEFIQIEDPEIEKKRKLAILNQMQSNLLGG